MPATTIKRTNGWGIVCDRLAGYAGWWRRHNADNRARVSDCGTLAAPLLRSLAYQRRPAVTLRECSYGQKTTSNRKARASRRDIGHIGRTVAPASSGGCSRARIAQCAAARIVSGRNGRRRLPHVYGLDWRSRCLLRGRGRVRYRPVEPVGDLPGCSDCLLGPAGVCGARLHRSWRQAADRISGGARGSSRSSAWE